MDTLETLLDQSRRGDREAFERIIESFRPRLRKFAWSRLRPELRGKIDVDDIIQDTSLKAMAAIESVQWQGESALLSWMCGIAMNVIYAHSRRYLRLNLADLDSAINPDGTSPSRHVRRNERFDRLEECLQSLTEDQREVVQLVRLEGLSIRQAAQKMNRTENATIQLLWRATQKLRQLFGDTASLGMPPDRNL